MAATDPHGLQRFVSAQEQIHEVALAELRNGRKQSHWMWFIFPQLAGLGRSQMARHYGIASLAEARAYLAHPLLGARLRECTQAVLDADAPSLHAIFGSPDDMKFRSSMTLFGRASDANDDLFKRALARWCEAKEDPGTLALL